MLWLNHGKGNFIPRAENVWIQTSWLRLSQFFVLGSQKLFQNVSNTNKKRIWISWNLHSQNGVWYFDLKPKVGLVDLEVQQISLAQQSY